MVKTRGKKFSLALKLALTLLIGAGVWVGGQPQQASADAKLPGGVAAGGESSLALLSDDTVMVWGRNELSQLGVASGTTVLNPVRNYTIENVRSIHMGRQHTLVVTKDNRLLGYGANYNSQLGYSHSSTYIAFPVTIPGITNPVTSAAAGFNFSMALIDKKVYVWGYKIGRKPMDGVDITSDGGQATPTQVMGLSNIKAIAAGDNYAAAINEDGDLFMWGDNEFGQLGYGDYVTRSTPVKVATEIESVALSNNHTVAVKKNGTVIAFGKNDMGQLGNGTNTPSSNVPVVVTGLTGIKEVALGDDHSVALGYDGLIRAWGSNYQGQFGDGTVTARPTPVTLGLNNVISIAAGFAHTLAYTLDGHVYSWGYNSKGQIGNGTVNDPVSLANFDQHAPVMVIDYDPPSTPTGLNVSRDWRLGKATVSWQPSVDTDIYYYIVYYRMKGDAYFQSNFVTEATTSCTIHLGSNSDFEFKIQAVDTSGFKSPESPIFISKGYVYMG